MAKQKGAIRIEGTLDNLSFYSSVFGDIVRRKGGASKEKIRKSPKFKRLRSYQEEFTNCIKMAKLLRYSVYAFSKKAPDHKLVGRVNKLMIALKNLDSEAVEGKRLVTAGLETDEGQLLLQGFEFNSNVTLDTLLKVEPVIEKGKIVFKDLITKKHIKAPKPASGVKITGIISKIDPKNNKHYESNASIQLKLDMKKQTIVLHPKAIKEAGFTFYFLQIVFLYEGMEVTKEMQKSNCLTLLTMAG